MASEPFSLVIENALLFDGSGGAPWSAEVALRGERIAAVEPRLPENAKRAAGRRLDLRGLALAPGFVDVHAHGELEPLADTGAAGKVLQGVTTEVCGNCGISAFPLRGALRERMRQEARDVFGWPPRRVAWTSPAKYLARLERVGSAINRAFLVGHGALRLAVVGETSRPVSELKKIAMYLELQEALDAGCLGLSTGLAYAPGCFASSDELMVMAGLCRARGAIYTTHMRSESYELEAAVAETLELARCTEVRTQISHLKITHPQNWAKIDWLDETLHAARREGLDLHGDQYPYAATSTGLDAVLPNWVCEGGVEKELERLADPAVCARLEAEVRARHPEADYWARVVVASAVDAELDGEAAGRSVADLAAAWKVAPFEALRRVLLRDRCRTAAVFHSICEEHVERIMRWDFVMIGSDATARDVRGPTRQASPHPRAFGTFPRVLGHYVREKKTLSLAEAIRRMTGLPADTFGLKDRGRVRAGCFADLVVFDPARIRDAATFGEPNRFPEGIEAVFVNGVQVAEQGRLLAARPGRVLRRAGPLP